jgi:AcrR family transcriptional regulator
MKEQILEGTISYLAKEGFHGLTLRPLGKAIGVSDRMIIYHFESKDKLLYCAMEAAANRIIEGINQTIRNRKIQSPSDFINLLWTIFKAPENFKTTCLFLEIEVASLRQPEPYRQIAKLLISRWNIILTNGFCDLGLSVSKAKALAEQIGPSLVGLFLFHSIEDRVRRPRELDVFSLQISEALQLSESDKDGRKKENKR